MVCWRHCCAPIAVVVCWSTALTSSFEQPTKSAGVHNRIKIISNIRLFAWTKKCFISFWRSQIYRPGVSCWPRFHPFNLEAKISAWFSDRFNSRRSLISFWVMKCVVRMDNPVQILDHQQFFLSPGLIELHRHRSYLCQISYYFVGSVQAAGHCTEQVSLLTVNWDISQYIYIYIYIYIFTFMVPCTITIVQ